MADAPIQWGLAQSPLGGCVLALTQGHIQSLQWQDAMGALRFDPLVSKQLQGWLDAWFQGVSVHLPLAPQGTPFQQAVWQVLQEIPWGQRRGYKQIASAMGRPRAVRAVANAIARNPIMLWVPCHRVVRSDGALGGYRGGDWRKAQLLQLEQNG